MIQTFILFFFYRYIIIPTGLILAFCAWPFNKKIRAGFSLRKYVAPPPHFNKKPIWIHASSGEFEYAKPVITELKRRHPDQPIVVTYFSPSYEKQIRNFNGVNYISPLPLDLASPIHSFIKRIDPAALLVARTDLWPELLLQVKKAKIPSLLFSATFGSSNNFKAIFNFVRRISLRYFTKIYLVSEQDKQNLQTIGDFNNVMLAGDTRYDQVLLRLTLPSVINTSLFNSRTKYFIAGSTWPIDDDVVIPALKNLVQQSQMKLVIAPHEVNMTSQNKLLNKIRSHGLTAALYSRCTDNNWQVLIIDQVGLLAELYTLGTVAFVGGSFKHKVHSVMEPLAAGLPTFVGPYHTNNREAMQFLSLPTENEIKCVTVVKSSLDLEAHIKNHIDNFAAFAVAQQFAAAEVRRRSGGAAQVVNWLETYLN